MSRPDQSFYLAHFTKNGKNYDGTAGPHEEISEMSAFERLIGILENKKIGAFELPWTGKKADVLQRVRGVAYYVTQKHIVPMVLVSRKN